MKYHQLGKSDLKVSVIAFGAWGLGGGNVWSDMTPDVESTASLLDEASDLGINYIDTAPVYGVGVSEMILGKALKGRRDRFILQTKCSLNWRNEGGTFEYERDGKIVNRDHSASAIRKDVEDSLRRLDTDVIDSIVVHRMSSTVPVEETMGELMKLKEEGKIRAVVLSNSTPGDLEEYSKYGDVAAVQEKFSLINDKNRAYFETCSKYGCTFQVYGSLEEGALTGKKFYERNFGEKDVRGKFMKEPYLSEMPKMLENLEKIAAKYDCSVANLIQAWTLAQYENMSLLTGFRRKETMQDTCRVFDIALSAEDAEAISQEAKRIKELL